MGRGRALAAFLTVLAVVGLIVFVVIAINTYDTDDDVQAVRSAEETDVSAAQPSAQPAAEPAPAAAPPVGGVATGGGGTAGDSGSSALPVVGALAALTLLGGAAMLWRPQRA